MYLVPWYSLSIGQKQRNTFRRKIHFSKRSNGIKYAVFFQRKVFYIIVKKTEIVSFTLKKMQFITSLLQLRNFCAEMFI